MPIAAWSEQILRGDADAVGWLVATVFFLMMSAAGNCWTFSARSATATALRWPNLSCQPTTTAACGNRVIPRKCVIRLGTALGSVGTGWRSGAVGGETREHCAQSCSGYNAGTVSLMTRQLQGRVPNRIGINRP